MLAAWLCSVCWSARCWHAGPRLFACRMSHASIPRLLLVFLAVLAARHVAFDAPHACLPTCLLHYMLAVLPGCVARLCCEAVGAAELGSRRVNLDSMCKARDSPHAMCVQGHRQQRQRQLRAWSKPLPPAQRSAAVGATTSLPTCVICAAVPSRRLVLAAGSLHCARCIVLAFLSCVPCAALVRRARGSILVSTLDGEQLLC